MYNVFLFRVIIIVFIIVTPRSFAQNIDSTSNKKNENIIESPHISFGKGLRITSSDSLNSLVIRFRMQNRFTGKLIGKDHSFESMVRRLRLRFNGYVMNPKYRYDLQLSFAPKDVGSLEDGGDIQIIRDAMFYFVPNKFWQIGFGQTKLPGNRQRVNSSGELQLTDRTINNSLFNIDRDFGFQAYYFGNRIKGLNFNIKTAISTGEGRNYTKKSDKGLAYTARFEFFPFGNFLNKGEYFEGDLSRETSPKIMVSGTYHYNSRALRTMGQRGDELFVPKDMRSTFVDFIGKYKGWALMLAYMDRDTNNPVAINPANTNELNYVFVGHGYDSQLSYIFNNNIELVARFSKQYTNPIKFNRTEQNQYSFGITKYIWKHAFKLQAEVTNSVIQNKINEQSEWLYRLQMEFGI